MTAFWHTLLQLAGVAVPVLAGLLAGRYIRRRHLDETWLSGYGFGYRAGLKRFSILDPDDDLDEVTDQLTAAVEQATPTQEPWWN